jgi:Tol biopolymer transport system component/predicted Ser/Thr protein kinase
MSDLIGKTLGPYRILEQIGVGGMATVYRAYQPSMDRDVAIKVLPHYLSEDKQFAERFQREAHAIAKLEHPHILPVHDYGECDGVTYIAMRYVQAGTLKELMSKGRLSLDEINRLIGQIGSALDYAHSQGVIHRDIKPSNVLIDPQGNTYLTDFGLARMLEASQQLTASGVGLGTPAYMSPEQGQGIKVDHRSDIYSLGVMLYEMATGRVPYEAETPMAVVLKHITEPLPLPRAVAPNVPEVIEKVILRAMAKDPAHRFQSACDLVQALNQAVRKASPPEPAQPTVVAEAMPTREHIPLAARIQRMQEKPGRRMVLAIGAIVVLAVFGLLFSQLPPVAPQATATMTIGPVGSAAATIPARATTGAATPMPTSAPPKATNTPSPLDAGEWLDLCGNDDVCIRSRSHGDKLLGLANSYNNFRGLSWSPDGSRFAFGACRMEDLLNNPTAGCRQDLFVASRDGKNVTALLKDPDKHEQGPAWSPDGEWIAYEENGFLAIVRPDGTGRKILVAYSDITCAHFGMAWSPDSQRIAWIGGACFEDRDGISDRVWVIYRDGTGAKTIFQSADPLLAMDMIAWSPDGRSIAVQLENGVNYLIAADCADSPVGCAESARTELQIFPDHWRHTFYPQWAGEAAGAPGALWLDGKTGYVRVPFADSLHLAQALTVEAWVNIAPRRPKTCADGAGYCNFMPIIAQSNPSSSIGNYVLAVDQGQPLFGFEPASVGDVVYRTEATIGEGWHHLAVVHTFGQPAKTQLFLDGQPISGAWPRDRNPDEAAYTLARTPYLIGYMTVGPEAYFQGLMDELRVWKVARTPEEIRATMKIELAGNEKGLVGYWKFNEPANSTIARDSSPNGNDGALQGGAQIRASDTPVRSLTGAPSAVAPCRTVGTGDQTYDLFVQDCDGSNKRRLTVDRGFGSKSPSWSPDGQRIVFDGLFGEEAGQGDIYLINADGSNQTLFLAGGEDGFGNPAWSPDGERIAYMDGCNIKTIRIDGSDMTTVVKSTDMMNHPGDPEMCVYEAAWSPDSKRLAVWAWQFGESLPGLREERVAVVNADGTGLIDVAAFQMKEGNVTPYWSPDGSQVAYLVWEDNTARYYILNADGSNQPVEIDSIPDSWSQSHWPQWDKAPTPGAGYDEGMTRQLNSTT